MTPYEIHLSGKPDAPALIHRFEAASPAQARERLESVARACSSFRYHRFTLWDLESAASGGPPSAILVTEKELVIREIELT
jgi:hypothetical protein